MREFPPFRLDPVNQCLWRGDGLAEERILLAPKAFAVLRYLVEHPGRLVAHDELLDALWPKTHAQPAVAQPSSDRAATMAPDVRIARGQCIEGYGSKEAYYPVLEAIAGLCRGDGGEAIVQMLAAQAPTWLVQFPTLVTPDRGEA